MPHSSLLPPPSPTLSAHNFAVRDAPDSDADTASQRSISLSSPPASPRNSTPDPRLSFASNSDPRQSFASASDARQSFASSNPRQSFATSASSGSYSRAAYTDELDPFAPRETPDTSAAPSIYDEPSSYYKPDAPVLPTYPPPHRDDSISISSFASGSSRKTRPESLLVTPLPGKLVLGIALVDFNHLVGPRIEYSRGEIFNDEEVAKILPFLALPDGAHMSTEDYSYFHLVQPGPSPTTIFGISCNQQIAASSLLVKGPDVTRSTVQKAVVVLASKPVFGPIREKLRVVTTALFEQRDFTDASILDDFGSSLEASLRGQLTESGLYMGTSLRELVHTFRQRTLVLVKALMLQKRIMFYGYPVERLCTYQYSLVSLLPGLLQTLDDSGSPPLASRAPTLSKPSSLRTSDRKSMMAFMGLPLDIFGKDAFFQPYLPLQQLDMIKQTPSWLCGCTNSIVTHQKEIDLLVNTETGVFEFRDPKLERSAGLTAADRKWMDDIVTDVNEGWSEEGARWLPTIQFKGSDDYLRTKFEEYIAAALATVKYRDFVAKGEGGGVLITGGSGGDPNSMDDFNPLWISEFKTTNAYDVWERTTDSLLFDIVEPRHPCNEKPSVVADIGLQLKEGIQDLKLDQQLAPAREVVARTLTVGSTNFFKAVEGVKGRWAQRSSSSGASSVTSSGASSVGSSSVNSDRVSGYSTPVEVSKSDLVDDGGGVKTATQASFMRPFSFAGLTLGAGAGAGEGQGQGQGTAETRTAPPTPSTATPLKANVAAWSAGIGSFLSTRAPRFSISSAGATSSRGESSSAPPLASHQPQQEGVGVGLAGALNREQNRTMRSVTPPVAGRMVPPLGSVNGVGVEVAEVGRRKGAASDDGHGEDEVVAGYAL